MLSIRDIATSADDSDALQTSLQELQRRRQAKQQQQRRLQRDRDADLAEADEPFGPTQELAYSREVLHAWTRWYPKLRSAVAALAAASSHSTPPPLQDTSATAAASSDTCSSFLNDDLHALRSPFSVADTIRRAYPPLWAIPAGTIPAAYYADTAFMADTSPSASAAASTAVFHHGTTNGNAADVTDCQHHHAHAGRAGGSPSSNAMTDFSRRRCPVHILREALQLPSALSVSTATAATQSAVVTPSLSPPAPAPATTPTTTPLPVWASSSTSSVSSAPLTAAGAAPLPSQQLLRPLQRILARWPPGKSASPKVSAVLRSINIEARKREQWNAHVQKLQQQSSSSSGSNCNQDTISTRHGKPAGDQAAQTSLASSALANTSVSNSMHSNILGDAPLVALSEDANGRALYWPAHITNTRAVFTGAACLRDDFQGLGLLQQYERFDVVLALALTSPMQLVVDVVYAIDETSEGFGLSIAPVVKWNEGGGDGAGHDGESAGSSAHRPPPPQAAPRWPSGESAEAAAADNDTKCPLLLPSTLPSVLSDLNYAFQPATSLPRSTTTTIATAVDEPVTAVLRRNTLSSAPLSAYDILAGPVSQSHSIVLLRPTPEVVCASRARALQELELRWKLLRQALLDRLVAYEEEPAFPVRSSAEDEGGETAGPPAVQLPNADDYESPFIDRCAVQDGDLPEEPAGAAMLTEDEMRQQTRLPELQGRRKRKRKPLPTQSTHRHQEEDGGHPSVSWSPTSPQLSAAAASTAAVSTSTYSPQPDTPALITFAPQVSSAPPPHLFSEEKLKSGSGGVQGHASSSRARHRQDVSAPTKQPRTPSDPQPAQMINLSNPTSTGVSTSYLSVVEGSHVLSAAVRAAVARQTELEDAIRRHQKPVAAPRGALPRLSVAAPSPVSSSSPRREAPPPQLQQQNPARQQRLTPVDITHNASTIAPSPSPTFVSTPPSSAPSAALQTTTTTDLAPLAWDTVASPATTHGNASAKRRRHHDDDQHRRHKNHSNNKGSPPEASGAGVQSPIDNSGSSSPGGDVAGARGTPSLQLTASPAAQRTPRQRFSDRGAPIVPSLSTASATSLSPRKAASVASTALDLHAAVAATTVPSRSNSAARRGPEGRNTRKPLHQQHQPPASTQQRSSAAHPLLTSSFLHPEDSSNPDGTATPPCETASSQKVYHADTQTPPPLAAASGEQFLRTSTPHFASVVRDTAVKASQPKVSAWKTDKRPSLPSTSSLNSSTSSSAVAPLRSTATFPNEPAAAPLHDTSEVSPSSLEVKVTSGSPSSSPQQPRRQQPAVAPPAPGAADVHEPSAAAAAATATDAAPRGAASNELASSPPAAVLVRPSFSPTPSAAGSFSIGSSSLRDPPHHPTDLGRHPLPPPQSPPSLTRAANSHLHHKKGALQSPRSLAASAAAAALANSMAEAAAAHHGGGRHPKQSGRSAERSPSASAKVRELAGDDKAAPPGLHADKRKNENASLQDSPLPRKPSLTADTPPVPSLVQVPPAAVGVPVHADPHPLSLLSETDASTVQAPPHHPSAPESSTALSAAVNREVELPNSASNRTPQPSHGTAARKRSQQHPHQPYRPPPVAASPQPSPAPPAPQRSHTARQPKAIREEEGPASPRSNSHPSRHRSHHRHHQHHRRRSPSNSSNDLRNRDGDSVRCPDPVAPTQVPPLRLRQSSPPSTTSGRPHKSHKSQRSHHRRSQRKGEEEGQDQNTRKSARRRVMAHLVSPSASNSASASSSSSRSRSTTTSPASSASSPTFSSARNASAAPQDGVPATSSASSSFSSSFPSPSMQRPSARKSPQLHKTVVVRRVVRRRRSEVFVGEGGSLVYRTPLSLPAPSHAPSSPPSASTRTSSSCVRRGRKARENS